MIDHNFKKKFGQNFISDGNLLEAIVNDAGVTEGDDVLEIGAGAGSLTSAISQKAKKVVSYEIDKDLESHLLSLNLENTKFIFEDIMKLGISQIEENFSGGYKLIANLPYYITTPIIFKFLNESDKITSLCIMVQKEVALRMIAKKGKDYGVLSIMIDFFGDAKICREVGRGMFFPSPNVDSAVVLINIDRNKFPGVDKNKFYKFIQTCFAMRRKTLKNNLSKLDIPAEKMSLIDQKLLSSRPEMLDMAQFIQLYRNIFS